VSLPAGDIADFLCAASAFSGVDAAHVRALTADFRLATFSDGAVVVAQGDSHRTLYVVISGQLRVSWEMPGGGSRVLFYVDPGETVCEMSLVSDDPAAATVAAVGETVLVSLHRDDFDRFSATYPDAALHLVQSLSRRLQAHRLSIALHLGHLFDSANPELLSDLESELEMSALYGGEILFRQGEPGDSLCLVINGRVRVFVRNDQGEERAVAELGAGEVIGEIAVVTGERRTATVVAIRDTQVARLTKAAFDRLVLRHPAWAVRTIGQKLAQRLIDANAGRSQRCQVSTIAVVPIHRSAPAGPFCEQLLAPLSSFGPAVHVTSADVDRHLGRPGISQTFEREGANIRVVEWLAKQETEHRYVIYQAEPFLCPWTERCIRQADHVILLGDGASEPALGEVETELLSGRPERYGARQWLVLAHDRAAPSGTRHWLANRDVERYYHVRLGDRTTFDRLGRLLTGRAVGLTLGGGFARGLAHLGVFRAFEEMGIPIDAIGSASMGGLLGGLRAMGWDRDRIQREVCAACADHFGDMTFPFVAFKRGGKFSQNVRNLFGDVQIEDLWLPYFCISANLNRSELKLHTQGSLAKAVLASTRAPGVFPPIVYDGELHVDGGVINNVPVDLMKEFCNQGVTIGVDVAPPHELRPVRDYGDAISGWKTFWKRCFSAERVYTPSILLVLIRTLEYTGISNQHTRLQSADVFMRPDMLPFKRTDFHLAASIVEAGYECAKANLLKHREKLTGAITAL
jgi:NTE family protein/lysophospholipid hydrolase